MSNADIDWDDVEPGLDPAAESKIEWIGRDAEQDSATGADRTDWPEDEPKL